MSNTIRPVIRGVLPTTSLKQTVQRKRKTFQVRYMTYPSKLNKSEKPRGLSFFLCSCDKSAKLHTWNSPDILCPLFPPFTAEFCTQSASLRICNWSMNDYTHCPEVTADILTPVYLGLFAFWFINAQHRNTARVFLQRTGIWILYACVNVCIICQLLWLHEGKQHRNTQW